MKVIKCVTSLDAERTFDKTQQLFMTKTQNTLGMEGVYLNIIKMWWSTPIILALWELRKKTCKFEPRLSNQTTL